MTIILNLQIKVLFQITLYSSRDQNPLLISYASGAVRTIQDESGRLGQAESRGRSKKSRMKPRGWKAEAWREEKAAGVLPGYPDSFPALASYCPGSPLIQP